MAKNRMERVDERLSKIIDKLVKKGYKRIHATREIAKNYEKNNDYAGFID